MGADLEAAAALAGEEGARAFWRALAETPLLVLLQAEARGDNLTPRLFDLEDGRFVLAFTSHEALASMVNGPVAHAELPGRVLIALLAEGGLGLGLDLGAGGMAERLLPAEALAWAAEQLGAVSGARQKALEGLAPPDAGAVAAVAALLASAPPGWGGLAVRAGLYKRDDGLALVVEGVPPAALGPLAQALGEALRLADLGGRAIDLAFGPLPGGGEVLAWPVAPDPVPDPPAPAATPRAPGMDPARPPVLRRV